MSRSAEQLQAIADPVVTGLGYELVGIELIRPGVEPLLRIYIDSDAGVDVADCERVSRQLSAVFDVEDPVRGHYVLEVSSPGFDRPLFTLAHFQRFLGEEAQIRLRHLFDGRRRLRGELIGVEGEEVVVREPGEPDFRVPHELIERANLVPKY